MKEVNGRWTSPVVMPLSGKYDNAEVTLSPNGNKLAFISLKPSKGKGDPLEFFDIWIVERAGLRWGKPVHLDCPINSDKMEVYPAHCLLYYYPYFSFSLAANLRLTIKGSPTPLRYTLKE